MSGAPTPGMLTMSVHASSRGFGWVVYENPLSPHDWGLVKPAKDKQRACIRHCERLLERFSPSALILESSGRHHSARSVRIHRLNQAFIAAAAMRNIEVSVYTRGQVQSVFASVGARTRHEIAEAIARQTDALRPRLPKRRRAWDSEDPRMALFSAAALVATHYRLGASKFFEDLLEQARGS